MSDNKYIIMLTATLFSSIACVAPRRESSDSEASETKSVFSKPDSDAGTPGRPPLRIEEPKVATLEQTLEQPQKQEVMEDKPTEEKQEVEEVVNTRKSLLSCGLCCIGNNRNLESAAEQQKSVAPAADLEASSKSDEKEQSLEKTPEQVKMDSDTAEIAPEAEVPAAEVPAVEGTSKDELEKTSKTEDKVDAQPSATE